MPSFCNVQFTNVYVLWNKIWILFLNVYHSMYAIFASQNWHRCNIAVRGLGLFIRFCRKERICVSCLFESSSWFVLVNCSLYRLIKRVAPLPLLPPTTIQSSSWRWGFWVCGEKVILVINVWFLRSLPLFPKIPEDLPIMLNVFHLSEIAHDDELQICTSLS